MEIRYRSPFRKFVKRQARPLQLAIEDEVEKIAGSPEIGETKKGDLAGFRVHKFSFQGQKYLVSYRLGRNRLVFFTVGSHENFYRDLKKYTKEADDSDYR